MGRQNSGFTFVELLVTIAIIGVLAGLLVPAIMTARESARQLHCENNLRQIGMGTLQFEGSKGHYPTGGWGWRWVPDHDPPSKYGQPGGWIYQLLPFVDSGELYALPQVAGGRETVEAKIHELLATPCLVFQCPSRGNTKVVPFNSTRIPLISNLAETPARVALTDYAANGGTKPIGLPGPAGRSLRQIDSNRWPQLAESDGMILYQNRIRMANVTAGSSNVLWVGEKFVGHLNYSFDHTGGNDQSMYSGECSDIRRYATMSIIHDSVGGAEITVINGNKIETEIDYGPRQAFGSPHPATMNAVMADGSTRRLGFDIDWAVFRLLSIRHLAKSRD